MVAPGERRCILTTLIISNLVLTYVFILDCAIFVILETILEWFGPLLNNSQPSIKESRQLGSW